MIGSIILVIIVSCMASQDDKQFEARMAKVMYKTSNQHYGNQQTKLPPPKEHGINGKFTDHLIYSGMYKNASLNTTGERDRWVNGSKDWMEHLG